MFGEFFFLVLVLVLVLLLLLFLLVVVVVVVGFKRCGPIGKQLRPRKKLKEIMEEARSPCGMLVVKMNLGSRKKILWPPVVS